MADQLTLPLARNSDPPTSHAAAAAVTRSHGALEHRILIQFLTYQELTDDELVRCIPDRCEGTVKTARSRLKNAGALVPTGETRPSRHGVEQIVWKVAS